MESQAANALYAELHKAKPYHDGTFENWSADRTAAHPYKYDEGVTIWIAETDLAPHDHFLGGAHACEECQDADPDEPDDEEVS